MTPAQPIVLTRKGIDRAGRTLRASERGEDVSMRARYRAWMTLDAFRTRWSTGKQPLASVNMSLRSMSRTAGVNAVVAQRLKRRHRIVDKLDRLATMRLSQMQDIGGCRAVVRDRVQLAVLRRHIERVWGSTIVHTADYVESPRDSGYRAVHLVVRRHGSLVEVQLRTEQQHRWAASIEAAEYRLGAWLREAPGGVEISEIFKVLADFIDVMERGEDVPPALRQSLHDGAERLPVLLSEATL